MERFYQLNPELVRQKQDYNLMDEDEAPSEYDLSKAPELKVYAPSKGDQEKQRPIKTPKLDLTKALNKH